MGYYVGVPKKLDIGKKPSTTHLFLAEGEAEVGLIEAYLSSQAVPEDTSTIVCFGGVSSIMPQADDLAKFISNDPIALERIVGIGFVADADQDASARADAAIQVAKSFGFQGAAQLKAEGAVAKGSRSYAYFIAPGNGAAGRLEDVILNEVTGTQLYGCIEASFECVEGVTGQKVDTKAAVQMYISARMNNSMAGIRAAFKAGIFDVAHEAYSGYRQMIDAALAGH